MGTLVSGMVSLLSFFLFFFFKYNLETIFEGVTQTLDKTPILIGKKLWIMSSKFSWWKCVILSIILVVMLIIGSCVLTSVLNYLLVYS